MKVLVKPLYDERVFLVSRSSAFLFGLTWIYLIAIYSPKSSEK